MSNPLENAKRRLAELEAEAQRIRLFLAMYEEFSEGTGIEHNDAGIEGTERNLSTERLRRGPRIRVGPTPAEIADAMERLLRDVGRPMTRGEIVAALEMRDLEIPAQDKPRYIGTLAWRNKSKFINIEGRGYWLRGLALISDAPIAPESFKELEEEYSDELTDERGAQSSIFDR
jgi:hypothetical protein